MKKKPQASEKRPCDFYYLGDLDGGFSLENLAMPKPGLARKAWEIWIDTYTRHVHTFSVEGEGELLGRY